MNNEFKTIDGKVLVTNSEVKVKTNQFSKRELKYHGKKFLIITLITLTYKYFFKSEFSKSKVWNYTLDGFIWFGFIVFLLVVLYAIFYYNFKNNIQISEIKEIEISKLKKKTIDITLTKTNNRSKFIEFEKETDEYKRFIDLLKKRNTRMKIIQL